MEFIEAKYKFEVLVYTYSGKRYTLTTEDSFNNNLCEATNSQHFSSDKNSICRACYTAYISDILIDVLTDDKLISAVKSMAAWMTVENFYKG